ncbi:MAG: hypothetical protein K5773_00445 [Pseudobutyrivibrio sp.]|nr:hypothetical protein [Pseudobutyrivibrio sp.]
MKKKKRIIILALVLVIAVLAGLIGLGAYYYTRHDLVYAEVYLEAGTADCSVEDFLKREESSVKFSKDSKYDTRVPGDYPLTILWEMPLFGQQKYTSVLHVTDTTAPVVKLTSERIQRYTSEGVLDITDFIESVEDIGNCSIDFAEEYDFSQAGEYDVEILVTDPSGNTTKSQCQCTIVDDHTPPVISGVEPLVIAQGESISYKKNITVTDDYDDAPVLEVDTTGINPDKRGQYTITYIATDAAGNSAKATTSVKIVSAKIAEATEETVNAMADQILSEIIVDGMDQKSQAKAVFDWVVDNITYSETAGIDDLYSAAYKGMHSRIGDCTVKQKTAEVMLNRLGIKNMEIEKIRDTRGHYWLLIDIDEGWYHYDPNLQLDGTLIFYWHDADLWAYSNAHKNTHNYDPSKYPTIQ